MWYIFQGAALLCLFAGFLVSNRASQYSERRMYAQAATRYRCASTLFRLCAFLSMIAVIFPIMELYAQA